MKKLGVLLIIGYVLVHWCLTTSAASPVERIRIAGNKISEAPKIDGVLGDAAWKQAFFVEANFLDSNTKKPISDLTRVWLGYDDSAIYVALEADKNGKKIVARETKDNSNVIFRDDTLGWSFNAFKTLEGHLDWWVVNPKGAKMANFSQGKASKAEWNDWVVKTGKTQDGWCLEMQVPWALLDLPEREGSFVFWVNFNRGDDGRLSHWKYGGTDDPAGNWAEWEVSLKAISSAETTQKTSQTKILADLFGQKFLDEKPYTSIGATAQRGGLTLTAFPEWRTLEGPIEGLDPVWGERYYREYRPFFQEGIGIVPPGDFYYSRRIQDIDLGLNFVKSSEKLQFATIDTIHRGGKYTGNARVAFLPTKSSNVSGGYLFDRRLQKENNVYYLMAQQRWKPLSVNGCFSQSLYDDKSGKNMRASATYYRGNLSSTAMVFTNDSTFVNKLGYGDVGIRGINWSTDYSRAWREKLMRYVYLSPYINLINREDGGNFRKIAGAYIVLIENHDYGFLLYGEAGDYEEFTNQYMLNARAGWHFSDSYNNFGVSGILGRNQDVDYKLLNPYVSIRVKGLTTKVSSQFYLTEKARDWQTVITLSYDLASSWAVAGRWAFSKANHQDGGAGYLGFRRSQVKGINLFLMIGDPNSQKFQKGGAIKIIIPVI